METLLPGCPPRSPRPHPSCTGHLRCHSWWRGVPVTDRASRRAVGTGRGVGSRSLNSGDALRFPAPPSPTRVGALQGEVLRGEGIGDGVGSRGQGRGVTEPPRAGPCCRVGDSFPDPTGSSGGDIGPKLGVVQRRPGVGSVLCAVEGVPMDPVGRLRRREHGSVPGKVWGVWGAWGLALGGVGLPGLGHRRTPLSHAPMSREGAQNGGRETVAMLRSCKFVSCVSGVGAGSGGTWPGWAVLTPAPGLSPAELGWAEPGQAVLCSVLLY